MTEPAPARTVFKILPRSDWEAARASGAYAGSADDVRDGFIHLSTAAQLDGTARRHFAGKPDLLLVAFEAAALGAKLVWEPSRGGALFPHLYAALPAALAVWQTALPLGADGVPLIPDLPGKQMSKPEH